MSTTSSPNIQLESLKDSKYPAQSQDFIDLVTSEKGKAILEKYGFSSVNSSLAEVAGNAAVR